MSERVSPKDLRKIVGNLNRYLYPDEGVDFIWKQHVEVETRQGGMAELNIHDGNRRGRAGARNIAVGSREEIYDFTRAMFIGIDLARGGKMFSDVISHVNEDDNG